MGLIIYLKIIEMRTNYFMLFLLMFITSYLSLQAQADTINYFNQEPPGDSAIIFAPGTISLNNRYEYCPFFAPDGKTFYFGVTNSSWSGCKLWVTKFTGNSWTSPAPVSIIDTMDGWVPTISADEHSFYFSSAYPKYPPANIWKCDIINDTLTNLRKLCSPINSTSDEWRANESKNYNIVFSSNRAGTLGQQDLYCSFVINDTNSTPLNFGKPDNSSSNDASAFLAPDESYIIFESERNGGFGQADLYITFKKEDHSWTNPKNMGSTINSSWIEDQPSVTPDGKYLIFCRREAYFTSKPTHIYWISSSIIDDLKSTNFIPYVKNNIPDLIDTIEKTFFYRIPESIFMDDDINDILTLSTENLPDSLYFNSETNTLYGKLLETGSYDIKITATDTSGASVSDVFNLKIEESTGIYNSFAAIDNISVYPNPAKNTIYIEYPELSNQRISYKLIDITGIILQQGKMNEGTIDISRFKKGVYILNIEIGKYVNNERIIVE